MTDRALSRPISTPFAFAPNSSRTRQLMKAFWLGVAALIFVAIISTETTAPLSIAGAFLIASAAVAPSYLWCSGRASGMPIFPVFAMTHLWTCALPLLSSSPDTLEFKPEEHFYAALTVAGFLVVVTFVWLHFVSHVPRAPQTLYVFKRRAADSMLLGALASAVLFHISFTGGWFYVAYDIFASLRNAVINFLTAAVFVVTFFKGSRLSFRRLNSLLTVGPLLMYLLVILAACAGSYFAYRVAFYTLPATPEAIGPFINLVRNVTVGLGLLAVFVLAYRWGHRDLSRIKVFWLLGLLAVYSAASAASLLLVEPLSLLFLTMVAFTIGRHRIPWVPLIGLTLIIAILHLGKGTMREKYWGEEVSTRSVQPWDYPRLYAEWVSYSLAEMQRSARAVRQEEENASLTQRAGLIHLLLLAQKETAAGTALLYGETYLPIPQLLIPRFIMPDKLGSHEGTTLLNVHYGKQTREDTERTTIGWGLLNEAYANFGLWGCLMLAVVIGAIYGKAAQWSMHAPLLSFRFLYVVLLTSLAFQSEFPASVYCTALFQSSVVLLVVLLLLMEPYQPNKATQSASSLGNLIPLSLRRTV